jgi:hypothetical protein
MPQVSIVTEGGLMHQCLSPTRISKRNCRSERLGPTSPTATSAAERSGNTPMSKLHGTEVRRSRHHRSVINVIAMSQHLTGLIEGWCSNGGDSAGQLAKSVFLLPTRRNRPN